MLKAIETANQQAKTYLNLGHTQAGVDVIQSTERKFKAHSSSKPQIRFYSKPQPERSNLQHERCGYCGSPHAKGRDNCPAYGKVCRRCGKKNHFQIVCSQHRKQARARNEAVYTGRYQEEYAGNEEECVNLHDIRQITLSDVSLSEINCREWTEVIKVNNINIVCKVDTGAQANIMSNYVLNKLDNSIKLTPSKITLNAYGGTKIPVLGKIKVNCKLHDESVVTDFIIVPLNVKTIIGLDTSSNLKVVKPIPRVQSEKHITSPNNSGCDSNVNHVGQNSSREKVKAAAHNSLIKSNHDGNSDLDTLLDKCKDVFDETKIACMIKHPYEIRLKPNPEPKVHAPRKVAFAMEEQVEQELKKMEKLGVIALVDEPTDWVNSMVVVKDPKLRICLDPLDLNKAVMRDHTSLPSPDQALTKLAGAKVFSKVDLRHGYWQVPLTKESSYLTTFKTPVGRYRYTRLPFGLNSANEVFQKRVSQVYEGLTGVLVIF